MNSRQPSVNGHGPTPIPRPQPVIAQPAPATTPRSAGDIVSGFAKLLQLGDSSGVTGTYVAARLKEFAVPRRIPSRVATALLGATMVAAGAATLAAFLGGGLTILFGHLITPGAAQVYNLWGTALVATSIPLLVLSLGTHALWQGRCSREAACLPVPESSQIRMVLRELRSVHDESAAAVKAKNEYGQALIGHATTIQNLEIKQAKLAGELGQTIREEELEQARHRTALAEEDLRRRNAEFNSAVHREVDAERERFRHEAETTIAEIRSDTAHEIARSAEGAAAQVAAAKTKAKDAVDRARREAALARGTTGSAVAATRQMSKQVAAAERAKEEAEAASGAQRLRAQQLQSKVTTLEQMVGTLRGELNTLRQPAERRAGERAQELLEQQHKVRVQQLAAQEAEHQAAARKHLAREEDDVDQFARECRQRFRRTADKQRAWEQLKRDSDAHLEEIARVHGQDSEAFLDAEQTFGVLINELRAEVNQ